MIRIDLTGQRFGRLIVLEYAGQTKGHVSLWLCKCDCGTEKVISSDSMKSGCTRSCGCLRIELFKTHRTTNGVPHGRSYDHVYRTWNSMLERCRNPNSTSYPSYGGRGISVCERWYDFSNFLSDMGERPEGMTIDRIDNNGDYNILNCKWSTPEQQAENRRSSVFLTYLGKTQLLKHWARDTGILKGTLVSRLRAGWSIEDTLTKPTDISKSMYKAKRGSGT